MITAVLAICAVLAALAASASPASADRGGNGNGHGSLNGLFNSHRPSWVDPSLIARAHSLPGSTVDVIIQSDQGTSGADAAIRTAGWRQPRERLLNLIDGIELKVPAAFMPFLLQIPGITVTPNSDVRLASLSSVPDVGTSQLWPNVTGNSALWSGDLANPSATPAIAVIDSGVAPQSQFGSRVISSVDLSTQAGSTADDQNGHGTFVAGIAAGASADLTGAAPTAPIVSVKVINADGTAKTSDVINAAQWVLDHKDQYNIKVANFSMHSSYGTNSYYDPLDKAVEKLWFSGITVVAAAGNYGTGSTPSNVLYSPGNDPFVITVGALDTNNTEGSSDDGIAPWSAYGHTEDGFMKPEIVAPGRYMVENVPLGSTLLTEFPTKVLDSLLGTMQISGTSFSAPVVSGTVAQMLARHPNLTPDQIKGELMQTARPVPNAPAGGAGVGEVSAYYAAHDTATPNPNAGLDQFVVPDPNGGPTPVFDADAWKAAVQADPTGWNAATYADSSWADSSWADSSWADSSWADSSWADSSWADSSWADSSWADSSWADSSWADSSWADSSWADESAADAAQEDAATGD
ncbi:MAG TPA: S8 family serine peptidase [Gaiellaceae bacterium]|jgi:serine protease AprX